MNQKIIVNKTFNLTVADLKTVINSFFICGDIIDPTQTDKSFGDQK